MEAIRSQARAVKYERAGARSAAPPGVVVPVGRQGWRWARISAGLIALAQQAVVVPAAAVLVFHLLGDDTE